MVTAGWLPVPVALLIGAILMVLSGALSMDEAYQSIEWKSVFLIAGMLPMGIAMEAKTELGETHGGLQAPHVVKHKGLYYMAYGDWVNICFATSTDGKQFTRVIRKNGKTGAFSEGPHANTRDPMLLKIGDRWHCYYCASSPSNTVGHFFCRTSADLKTWSHSSVVFYGGSVSNVPR